MSSPYDPSASGEPSSGPSGPEGYDPPPSYGPSPGYGPYGGYGSPAGYGLPQDSPAPQGYSASGYVAPGYAAPGYGPAGYPSPYGGGYGPAPANGTGTASLVLGIASFPLLFVCFLGIVTGPLAVVFGVQGRRKVVRGEADNDGMALAGIITGGIATALSLLVLVFFVVAIATSPTGGY